MHTHTHTRVGLNVDAPFSRIQTKAGESTTAAEILDLINDFVSAIIPVVFQVGVEMGVFEVISRAMQDQGQEHLRVEKQGR